MDDSAQPPRIPTSNVNDDGNASVQQVNSGQLSQVQGQVGHQQAVQEATPVSSNQPAQVYTGQQPSPGQKQTASVPDELRQANIVAGTQLPTQQPVRAPSLEAGPEETRQTVSQSVPTEQQDVSQFSETTPLQQPQVWSVPQPVDQFQQDLNQVQAQQQASGALMSQSEADRGALSQSVYQDPSQGAKGQQTSDQHQPQPSHVVPSRAPVQSDDQPPQQPEPVSGPDKERVEYGPKPVDTAPLVELKEEHEMEPEVEGWIEKLEKGEDIQIPQPVTDDDGNVMMADAGAQVQEDKIVLPMTEDELEQGLHMKVTSSARWLAEWCTKLIKQLGDGVAYHR